MAPTHHGQGKGPARTRPEAITRRRMVGLLPYRVRLAYMEHGGGPRPAIAAALLRAVNVVRFNAVLVLLALDRNERHHLDPMLTTAHLPAKRSPGVIREHVLARPYFMLWNPLGHKPGDDHRPIGKRFSLHRTGQRFRLNLLCAHSHTRHV